MDGGLAMEGDGPASGSAKWLGFLFASEDAVALDSSVMALIHGKSRRVWTTEIAARRGLGISDISLIDRTGPAFQTGSIDGFKMPGNCGYFLLP